MRLKLVLVSSLIAAVIGAGIPAIIVTLTLGSLMRSFDAAVSGLEFLFLFPLVTALLASLFVYRHTARRRKLQAALTIVISLLLWLALHLGLLFTNL